MARAPTRLKRLFDQPTSAAIADALATADCLSPLGRKDRKALIRLITDTLSPRASDGPPMPGPTPADNLESALLDHGYLNERGIDWAHTIVGPHDP
jgi:hypothetical protein